MTDVVLLNGVVGAGKTTTAEALSRLLGDRGVLHATVDLDELRRLRPAPADDPFCGRVLLANLAPVAAVYRTAGASVLVLAGVVETRAERTALATAAGAASLFVCRLTAAPALVAARIERRHADDPAGRAWHLDRATVLAGVLDAAGVDDAVVATDSRTPAEAAALVARTAGLII